MWSLLKQLRVDRVLMEDNPNLSLTLIVPSNAAWEKAQRSFSKAYNTLVDGQFPQYVSSKKCFIHSVLVNQSISKKQVEKKLELDFSYLGTKYHEETYKTR